MSILRAIRALMPGLPVLYVADQAHVPYGNRTPDEIRGFAEGITRFFIRNGGRLVVIACNTASAAALTGLRGQYPDRIFVGMEPAIKPAVGQTRTGVIGVLATQATFQGRLYASLVERFGQEVTILQDTCAGLVTQIETGNLDAIATREILEKALRPMLARGVDTLVLGCTHYPFAIPAIREIAGQEVQVIDPAPAVAAQVKRLLRSAGLPRAGKNTRPVRYYTTGDPRSMEALLPVLLGEKGPIEPLRWVEGELEPV